MIELITTLMNALPTLDIDINIEESRTSLRLPILHAMALGLLSKKHSRARRIEQS